MKKASRVFIGTPGRWFIFIVKRSIPSQKVKPHIVEVVAPAVSGQLSLVIDKYDQ